MKLRTQKAATYEATVRLDVDPQACDSPHVSALIPRGEFRKVEGPVERVELSLSRREAAALVAALDVNPGVLDRDWGTTGLVRCAPVEQMQGYDPDE